MCINVLDLFWLFYENVDLLDIVELSTGYAKRTNNRTPAILSLHAYFLFDNIAEAK